MWVRAVELLYTFVDLSGREQPREVLERTFSIDPGNEGAVIAVCCDPLGEPMPKKMADSYFELWRIDNRKRRARITGVPLVFVSRIPVGRLRGALLPGDEMLVRITVPSDPCEVMLAVGVFIDPGRVTR